MYCNVLCCIVLCFIVFYCGVMWGYVGLCVVMWGYVGLDSYSENGRALPPPVLHCAVLCCAVLYCAVLCCAILNFGARKSKRFLHKAEAEAGERRRTQLKTVSLWDFGFT